MRADIVEDLKKIASSRTVVHMHPQNHPHFAYRNRLEKLYATSFIYLLFFLRGGGDAIVYYIVQCINSYARVPRLKVF